MVKTSMEDAGSYGYEWEYWMQNVQSRYDAETVYVYRDWTERTIIYLNSIILGGLKVRGSSVNNLLLMKEGLSPYYLLDLRINTFFQQTRVSVCGNGLKPTTALHS